MRHILGLIIIFIFSQKVVAQVAADDCVIKLNDSPSLHSTIQDLKLTSHQKVTLFLSVCLEVHQSDREIYKNVPHVLSYLESDRDTYYLFLARASNLFVDIERSITPMLVEYVLAYIRSHNEKLKEKLPPLWADLVIENLNQEFSSVVVSGEMVGHSNYVIHKSILHTKLSLNFSSQVRTLVHELFHLNPKARALRSQVNLKKDDIMYLIHQEESRAKLLTHIWIETTQNGREIREPELDVLLKNFQLENVDIFLF